MVTGGNIYILLSSRRRDVKRGGDRIGCGKGVLLCMYVFLHRLFVCNTNFFENKNDMAKTEDPPPSDNPAFMVNNFMLVYVSPCQSENIPVCLGNYGRWFISM